LEQVASGTAVVLKADAEPGIRSGTASITKGNTESADFLKLLQILSQGQSLWANADTAEDVLQAQKLGAQGIGLLRTEHMVLNNPQTQRVLQAFYLLVNPAQRKLYEQPLIEGQAAEFKKIFALAVKVEDRFPITIRLLDFPMHEILPQPQDLFDLEKLTGVAVSELQSLLKIKHEENPMLGCRGVRLAMIFPELYDLQIKAVLQALQDFDPKKLEVKIMLPMVMLPREMFFWRERITGLIQGPYASCFKIGAMLEIPSACLQADEIAKAADFLSVGSNDLTQMCYGLSRDDATQIQEKYIQNQMLPQSLFFELGFAVGELIKQACALARKTRPQIPITVCGEHAGNLSHWDFWQAHQIGLSVAATRLPVLAWKFTQEGSHE
jgi:pyruvate,orthophosphate dikinase